MALRFWQQTGAAFTPLTGTVLLACNLMITTLFLFPLKTSSVSSSVKKSGSRPTQLFISKMAAFLLPFFLLQSSKHERFWPDCSSKETLLRPPSGAGQGVN